ncbi:hypothetical protein BFG60_3537 [Microcystis aeruginosa NIES-98]|nr:hypothetical protein BFG60_3537 [Microcystis aeruginosa NIES-98]
MSCQFTDYCLLFTVHCSLKIPPTSPLPHFPTSHTLHPTPYTLHPTPYTPIPTSPHPTPYTLHPNSHFPTPHTPHPTPLIPVPLSLFPFSLKLPDENLRRREYWRG